ncbi:MAG: VanZ family protein [Candidatus Sericytochromatia bacterium]
MASAFRAFFASGPCGRRRALFAALVWTGLLILLSSDQLSANSTAGLLERLLAQVGLIPGTPAFEGLHHLLRKSGHFGGYGLLALLWRWALRPLPPALGGWALALPLWISLTVAAWDEWHQSTLSQRSGTPADVLIDLGGACVCLGLLLVWEKRQSPPR